jgi:hypothetical protein
VVVFKIEGQQVSNLLKMMWQAHHLARSRWLCNPYSEKINKFV